MLVHVLVCTTPPPPPPQKKKQQQNLTTLMGTNILPENLKGGNILCNLGLHCQWVTYTFFYASIREVALPYKKSIVFWGERGYIHIETPPVRKGGEGTSSYWCPMSSLPPHPL